MQAIITRYIAPTNTRGTRYKASCARGSITVAYDYQVDLEANHIRAAQALVNKFCAEDESASYKTPRAENPWNKPRVAGCLPSGEFAHVFVGGAK